MICTSNTHCIEPLQYYTLRCDYRILKGVIYPVIYCQCLLFIEVSTIVYISYIYIYIYIYSYK